MSVTWNQFKELVDKQLKEESISGDTEIAYIDTSWPESSNVSVETMEGTNDKLLAIGDKC